MDCTPTGIGCSALWVGLRVDRSSYGPGAAVFVFSSASAVCRVCALRNCDYVLVWRQYAWHRGNAACLHHPVTRWSETQPWLSAIYDLVFLIFAFLMMAIDRARSELEIRVAERTADLTRANEDLSLKIAEHKRTEEKLRESEAYLAEAQKVSGTGSWARVSATGEMRYWSEECFRVLGFDPHDGPPRFETFLQRVHPGDQAKVRELSEKAGREKVDYETHYRIVHPGGELRDIHVVSHPVLGPSGELVEFVGTVMDVTERKHAEENLRQSEAYLVEAQKLTHTGSWVWEVAPRRALYLSEEWYRIYGFDQKDGMSAWDQRLERIHPDDRARRQRAIDQAISEKSEYELEYRIILPSGTIRHLHSVGHPVLDASGNLVQFVGSSTDITERRQAEEALRLAQADLARISRITTMGELTASLAHEVNQPIAAAVTDANTCLRWLSRDQPDLDEAREAASRMVKDATRAAEIISRTRLLFKKVNPQWESVDMHEIIREMVALMSGEAARYSISVWAELAAELPEVMGDRVQLQQVLMNLDDEQHRSDERYRWPARTYHSLADEPKRPTAGFDQRHWCRTAAAGEQNL